MTSFLQQVSDTSTQTTYTFSSQSLGAAAADRYIVASIVSRKAGTSGNISSVTIGGVTATLVGKVTNTSDGANGTTAMYIALVPTGTTGNVVVTYDTAFLRCSVGLWRVTDLYSPTPFEALTSTNADPQALLDIPQTGFAIGGCAGGASSSATWTGLTESFDTQFQTNSAHSGAFLDFPTAQTNLSIVCDWSNSGSAQGVFASWQYKQAKKVSSVDRLAIKKLLSVAAAGIKKVLSKFS